MKRLAFLMGLFVSSLFTIQPAAAQTDDSLSVRRVVLFTTGVGFFEHAAAVDGDQQLRLPVSVTELDDLLKSVVISDSGNGVAASLRFSIDESLPEKLNAFSVDLAGAPTMAELLQQLRGEEIQLKTTQEFSGVVLGLESKSVVQDGQTVDAEYVNLMTEDGLISLPLETVQRIRIKDGELRAELREALKAVAEGRKKDKRQVSIQFRGQGKREVRVGYIAEAPVWKATYRLRIDDDEAVLEGWSIIENTTESDWKDVRLSLVSGSPSTFRMKLANPYFTQRATMPLTIAGAPRSMLYDRQLAFGGQTRPFVTSVVPTVGPSTGGGFGGAGGGFGGGGLGGGGMGGFGGAPGGGGEAAALEMGVNNAFAAAAVGGQVGENFEYQIDGQVDLPRRASALLPVLKTPIKTTLLSIYSPANDSDKLMLGARLENNSKLHLAPGPMAVYDEGFAGEARIDHVRPGESRLISFAADLAIEVQSESPKESTQLTNVGIVRGSLRLKYMDKREQAYQFGNLGDSDRQLLIEHPKPADGWKVVSPTRAAEETDSLHRFELTLPGSEQASLVVREQKERETKTALATVPDEMLGELLVEPVTSEADKKTITKLITLRAAASVVRSELAELQKKIASLESDQNRMRSNLRELDRNTPLYQRYIKQLETQEDSLQELRKQQRDSIQRQEQMTRDLEAVGK